MSVLQEEAPPRLPIGTPSSSEEHSDVQPEAMSPIEQRMGPGKFPGLWKPVRSAFWAVHVAFGSACLILILAILAAIPGLNILTLGYLVDPQRRVANSGRLRDGFPLMTLAPRLGVIVFFVRFHLNFFEKFSLSEKTNLCIFPAFFFFSPNKIMRLINCINPTTMSTDSNSLCGKINCII